MKVMANGTHFTIYEEKQKGKRKTRDYKIVSKRGADLGRVIFYNKWRQHVLEPEMDTLWSDDCLTEIQIFLRVLKRKKL